MVSLENQETNYSFFEKNPEDLLSHKYNLFQQFFIVSFDEKILTNLNKINIKNLPLELKEPKIISKYPCQELPYINIPDSIIASHCFPNGLYNKIINHQLTDLLDKLDITENWIFSLDNIFVEEKDSPLIINKIYYTCYLFYENVANYKLIDPKNFNQNINKNILIPKVICLSSFTPLYKYSIYILKMLKDYIHYYNLNSKLTNIYPIETIIDGLIFNIPGLPKGNFTINLDKGAFSKEIYDEPNFLSLKSIPLNKTPTPLFNYYNLMKYFKLEEIFSIIKSILLEEPVLFFCEDIDVLSETVEGIINLIFPFKYYYPFI
jgi:hypothetical protein